MPDVPGPAVPGRTFLPGPGAELVPLHLELAPTAALPLPNDPTWRQWLTGIELGYCGGLKRAEEHLVARAMAKHGVARVLGWTADVPWHAVEIRRQMYAAPVLVVSGQLDDWRRQQGLPVPAVSLTHSAGYAAALAWLPPPDPGSWGRT